MAQSQARLSGDWKRAASANFVAVGNASNGELQNAAKELERFRQALLILFPSLRLDSHTPTYLVLFKSDDAMAPFKPRVRGRVERYVAGYFSRHADRNYMVTAVRGDRANFEALFHEYTHYVIHRSARRLPTWASEGLAEFYATFRTNADGRGVVGAMSEGRAQTLAQRPRLLPLDQVLTPEGTARALRSERDRYLYYAQSWLFVHHLLVGSRKGQLVPFLTALEQGQAVHDAFAEVFKVSYDEMRRELEEYMQRLRLPALILSMDGAAAIAPPMIERLTEADAQHLQGDLLVRNGASEEAVPFLKRALDQDPSHVGARVSQGLAHLGAGRAADAAAVLRETTAKAPNDFAGQYVLASALNQARQFNEGLAAASRATMLDERSPEAWLELSLSALGLERESQAEAAMLRVRQLDSSSAWYRQRAHRAFGIGQYEVITRDVASYLKDDGEAESPEYMAFLGAVAHWRLQQSGEARRLLAAAAESADPMSWTAAIASFLRREITPSAFLSRARGLGEETEAHTYIGLLASIGNNRQDALVHLRWVRERGDRSYTEYDLAVAELARLEAPPANP